MELNHFPIKISVNREARVACVTQIVPNGEPQKLFIHADQALEIADFLLKEFKRRGKGVPEGTDADFERFWSAYPVKTSKAGALSSWKRSHANKHVDKILAHVEAMKSSDQWKRGFIPHATTYLNQRRYEDEQKQVENPWDNAV